MLRIGETQLRKVGITLLEKRKRGFTVGFQEEVEMVRKVGFLVNHVKMMNPELNLVEERMHLKELSNDVDQHVPLARITREGEEQDELGRGFEKEKT
nr:hypothetical protein [bacterium]